MWRPWAWTPVPSAAKDQGRVPTIISWTFPRPPGSLAVLTLGGCSGAVISVHLGEDGVRENGAPSTTKLFMLLG